MLILYLIIFLIYFASSAKFVYKRNKKFFKELEDSKEPKHESGDDHKVENYSAATSDDKEINTTKNDIELIPPLIKKIIRKISNDANKLNNTNDATNTLIAMFVGLIILVASLIITFYY